MLRLTLALLAALTFALTACNSDEETLSDAATTSPTPTEAGDIVICPQIGVPGEAAPSSPTPEPSCEPGDDFTDIGPGISGRIAQAPPLPAGMSALTRYIEFATSDPAPGAVISLPLVTGGLDGRPQTVTIPIGDSFGWYTYESGQWRALDVTPVIHQPSVVGDDAIVEGNFDSVPANLILLAE